MNILIVDDSKSAKILIAKYVVDLGMAYELASDGIEALEKLANDGDHFDAILVDWEMPRMNGPEFVKEVRNRYPNEKIIMITSKNSREAIQEAKSLGVAGYIVKPFTDATLGGKLVELLGGDDG